MPLQSSGAISLANIQNEFGGTNPISLSEYYRGGGLVANTPSNLAVPTSGTIQLDDFYGASAPTGSGPYTATVLLMAGSGSVFSDSENGDTAGGSGAGGLYITTLSITPGASYAITIGAGGASYGINGGNTTVAGLPAAIGGGYGSGEANLNYQSTPGGSGGGGGAFGYGIVGNVSVVPGGTGTSGQGNPGGAGQGDVFPYRTGGGGGHGSAGSPGTSQPTSGPGGTGYNLATFKGGPAAPVAYGGGGGYSGYGSGNNYGAPPYVYPGYTDWTTPPPNTGAGVQGEVQGGGKEGTSGRVVIRYAANFRYGSGGNLSEAVVGGTNYFFHDFIASGTYTG